jgi:hypothetical protein
VKAIVAARPMMVVRRKSEDTELLHVGSASTPTTIDIVTTTATRRAVSTTKLLSAGLSPANWPRSRPSRSATLQTIAQAGCHGLHMVPRPHTVPAAGSTVLAPLEQQRAPCCVSRREGLGRDRLRPPG